MQSFMELIKTRQSCRAFDPRPVEPQLLETLAEAFRLSPSACNAQPWHLIVATGETAKAVRAGVQTGGRNKFTDNCPAFAVVVEEQAVLKAAVAEKFPSQTFAQMDIGLAVAQYCLAATDLGLSTCILGWMQEDELKAALSIDPSKRIRLVLATGYAAPDTVIRSKTRKPLEEVVEFRD